MNKKITFIRRAESLPAGDDDYRVLSKLGINQATDLRHKLGNPKYDLVFSSSAFRAQQTAAIIAGRTPDIATPHLISSKNPAEEKALCDLFTKLGHASLSTYRRHGGRKTLEGFGWDAMSLIDDMKMILIDISSPTDILVVGHGVLLCQMGITYLGKENRKLSNLVLDFAQGFTIERDGAGKTRLTELYLD